MTKLKMSKLSALLFCNILSTSYLLVNYIFSCLKSKKIKSIEAKGKAKLESLLKI